MFENNKFNRPENLTFFKYSRPRTDFDISNDSAEKAKVNSKKVKNGAPWTPR